MRWFAIVWGGSAAVAAAWMGVCLARRKRRPGVQALVIIAFCCAFTTHGAMTASTTFDIASLERPQGLALILVSVHAALLAWILGTRPSSEADRGLLLLLLFHALNRDLYLAQADLMTLFACIVVVQALFEDRGRLASPSRWIGVPLAVFLLWVGASIVLATEPVRALPAAAYIFVCACTWLLIAARPRRGTRFPLLTLGILVAASALVLLAAVVQLVRTASVLGLTATLSTRLGVLYQHPNMLGPYLATMALLSLALRPLVPGRPLRTVLALHAMACLGGLWLTDSRTAFAGCLAGAAVLAVGTAWLRWRVRPRVLHVVLAGLLVATIVASLRASSVLDSTRVARALEFRREAWAYALTSIRDHPVFGIGPDTFPTLQDAARGTRFSHTVSVPHPHNQLLYVAQSSGLPAAAVFIVLMGGYLVLALRGVRSDDGRHGRLALACLAGSTTLLVCGLFDDSQSFTTLISRPEWVFMGVICAIDRSRGTDATPGRGLGIVALCAVALAFGVLGLRPAAAQALADRAAVAERAGSLDAGAELAARALRVDPHHASALDLLIICELGRDDLQVALEYAEAAARRSPGDAGLQLKVGTIRRRLGDLEGAVAAFRRAVELGRGASNRAHYSRALIQALTQAGAASEARAALTEAVRIDAHVLSLLPLGRDAEGERILPVAGAAPIYLGSVLEDMRREALADVAGGEAPDRYRWWSLYLAHRQCSADLALVVLDDIERLFPGRRGERAAVAFQRGLMAEERGDIDEARGWMERAVAAGDPTSRTAERLYRAALARLSPGPSSTRVRELREVLGELGDFRTEAEVFVTVLDELLVASGGSMGHRERVELLERRAFFAVEPRDKARLELEVAANLSAADDPLGAEAAALRALRLLWDAERASRLQIDVDEAARESVQRAGRLLSASYHQLGLAPLEGRRRLLQETRFLERASVAQLLLRSFSSEP